MPSTPEAVARSVLLQVAASFIPMLAAMKREDLARLMLLVGVIGALMLLSKE